MAMELNHRDAARVLRRVLNAVYWPFLILTLGSTAQAETVLRSISAHLLSPTSSDHVIVSENNGHLFLNAVTAGGSFQTSLLGTYLSQFRTIGGLVARDLTGDGIDEIIVGTSDGASLGSYVRIFKVTKDGLSLISPPSLGAYDMEIKGAGNVPKLVLLGKWTESSLATAQVLRWNGVSFTDNSREAARVVADKVIEQERLILTPADKSPLELVTAAKLIVDLYIAHSQYEKAESLCQRLLAIIMKSTTVPAVLRDPTHLKEMGIKRPAEFAKFQKAESLSTVHGWLSTSYLALGDQSKSDNEQATSQDLKQKALKAQDSAQ